MSLPSASASADCAGVQLTYSLALPVSHGDRPARLAALPPHLTSPPASKATLLHPLRSAKSRCGGADAAAPAPVEAGTPCSSGDSQGEWLADLARGVEELRIKFTAELAYWKDMLGSEEEEQSSRAGAIEVAQDGPRGGGRDGKEDENDEEEEEEDDDDDGDSSQEDNE